MKKPFYKVKFSSTSCNFEIRINDIPLFTYQETGMISTQYPINHLILISGEQKLSCRVWPQADQDSLSIHSKLTTTILLQDATDDTKEPVEIFNSGTPEFSKTTPLFEQESIFNAEVPYTLPGWYKSSKIKEKDSLEKEVISFFKSVHSILKRKDYDTYRKIYDQKLLELDIALYSSSKETVQEWNELIRYLEASGMEIAPFPNEYLLQFCGDQKVVSLIQPDFEPVLFLENKAEKTQYKIPLFLHKPRRFKSLEVIR